MLVNAEGRVFVGKRIDNREGDWWQMPQGGVDPGEDLRAALLREVGEETGIAACHLDVLHQMPDEVFYDLPSELQGKLWSGKFRGQRQWWFLVRFTGKDSDIDLRAHKHPEFCEWKWIDPDLLPELIVPFKKDIYCTVVEAFRSHI